MKIPQGNGSKTMPLGMELDFIGDPVFKDREQVRTFPNGSHVSCTAKPYSTARISLKGCHKYPCHSCNH